MNIPWKDTLKSINLKSVTDRKYFSTKPREIFIEVHEMMKTK